MNQPVNPADIHKAIVEQQKIQDRKKLMVNGVLLLLLLAAPFVMYPVFLMKMPLTCCSALPACCPSAMRPSWPPEVTPRATCSVISPA
jgi:hypothetical protein